MASDMLVSIKRSTDSVVRTPGALSRAWSLIRPGIANRIMRLQQTSNSNLHTPAIFPSGLVRAINRSDADVVNLHWIGEETLSIGEIARIAKPIVWTMHDMWAFCGAEHYAPDDAQARWRAGYSAGTRAPADAGIDIDAWVWRRKKRLWRPCAIVASSRWLAQCARASALMNGWDITVVPNAIDTEFFRPVPARAARAELRLPENVPLLLFGSTSGTGDPRKGWDLLLQALDIVRTQRPDAVCVVIGKETPDLTRQLPLPVHWFGPVQDDRVLLSLYAAADATLVPSRQDNLPLMATEAQACGCPVVAFAATGLPDAVEHEVTGFLAEPFSPADLARGIRWVVDDPERHQRLRAQARARALALWAPQVVAARYRDLYPAAVEAERSRKMRK